MIEQKKFGTLNGDEVFQYTLKNKNGIVIRALNYGGIISAIETPNRLGKFENIVLGNNNLEDYLASSSYLGAIIGRFGNRIAKGTFELEGKSYTLAQNNGENHLHGGDKGFDQVLWKVQIDQQRNSLCFEYKSIDNEEGYPGTLDVRVTYLLDDNNILKIKYHATTTKTTILNLTQHSYFNLSGNLRASILDHQLQLEAKHYLPIDENSIPTGQVEETKDTPFDFSVPKTIGQDIHRVHPQLKIGNGFDHCFVLNNNKTLKKVAQVSHQQSGRSMAVWTDQPGMQLYTGNYLDQSFLANGNRAWENRTGVCFETQHYPDSPNQTHFPSPVLRPGEVFSSETYFEFLTINP